MKHSSSERFLKGKSLRPGESPVKKVTKFGGRRTVHRADGTRETITERKLKNHLVKAISNHQLSTAWKGRRSLSSGKVSISIGGRVKGDRRTYSGHKAAARALAKHHGRPDFLRLVSGLPL